MYKVTPIGSCRITGPLRNGQAKHGIELNMDRVYGYCHSPAEAIQLTRFVLGEIEIPAEIWPLVSRKHNQTTLLSTPHRMSDLYVVELASAKEITIDGVCIQLNYLNSLYSEFFADINRAKAFWAVAEEGDASAMAEFMDQEWSATQEQQNQAKLLSRIKRTLVSEESLLGSVRTLMGLLPDVLFVSHVDAIKINGAPIKSRSDFISMVARAVHEADGKFYNPTDLMHDYGQPAAIEDESTSLAHFTKPFSDALMDDWMHSFIAPATDALGERGSAMLQAQVDAALDVSQFAAIKSRVFGTPFENKVNVAQQAALSAFKGDLQKLLDNPSTHDVETAAEIGAFDTSLALATLLNGGFGSMSLPALRRIARLAEANDAIDTAYEFHLAALSHYPDHAGCAGEAAALALSHQINLLGDLDARTSKAIMANIPAIDRLRLVHLNNGKAMDIVDQDTTADDIHDIAVEVSNIFTPETAAYLLFRWRELQRKDRITAPAITVLLDDWVKRATDYPTYQERIDSLNTLLLASPRHSGVCNAMRDERKNLNAHIRDLGNEGDIDALEALVPVAKSLPQPLPDLDLWRARARYKMGQFEQAVELGQSAAKNLPDNITVWMLLMRAAKGANNTTLQREYAQRVIDLSGPDTDNLRKEAENLLGAQGAGA